MAANLSTIVSRIWILGWVGGGTGMAQQVIYFWEIHLKVRQ